MEIEISKIFDLLLKIANNSFDLESKSHQIKDQLLKTKTDNCLADNSPNKNSSIIYQSPQKTMSNEASMSPPI